MKYSVLLLLNLQLLCLGLAENASQQTADHCLESDGTCADTDEMSPPLDGPEERRGGHHWDIEGEEKWKGFGDAPEEEEDEDAFVYKTWDRTEFTLDDFSVNGINLASYGKQPLFELYHDFDISSLVRGDEEWEELLSYRNGLTRPSLSFYVDKVARKRWLPARGYPQPKVYLLKYADELMDSQSDKAEKDVILEALPKTGSFCAKPTHMSLTKGTWLVDHQEEGPTRFSLHGLELADHDGEFDARVMAEQLAESLHDQADDIESWALKNVQPGLVVEERWCSHTEPNAPPHEFNMFTIWGRVWVGQWNHVEQEHRYCYGFIHRNGTMSHGGFHPVDYKLPDWLPWKQLVTIAEQLGAHKDMFRTDIFVGRPCSADPAAPLQIAVSESEIFPTTIIGHDELSDEGARLWIAGYMLGIFEVVENTEVPLEFLIEGQLGEQ